MSPIIPYRGTGSRDTYIFQSPDHRGKLVKTPLNPFRGGDKVHKPVLESRPHLDSTRFYRSPEYKKMVELGARQAQRRMEKNNRTLKYGPGFSGYSKTQHPGQGDDLGYTPCGSHKNPHAMKRLQEATINSARGLSKYGKRTLTTNPNGTIRSLMQSTGGSSADADTTHWEQTGSSFDSTTKARSDKALTPNGYHYADGSGHVGDGSPQRLPTIDTPARTLASTRAPAAPSASEPRNTRSPRARRTNLSLNLQSVRDSSATKSPRSPAAPSGLATSFRDLPVIKRVTPPSSEEWLRRSRRQLALTRTGPASPRGAR